MQLMGFLIAFALVPVSFPAETIRNVGVCPTAGIKAIEKIEGQNGKL
jgi:hypothetical protein